MSTAAAETQIITVLAPTITPAALEIITDTLGSARRQHRPHRSPGLLPGVLLRAAGVGRRRR
ncbi:MAG: hypothetical protein R2704_03435 [Microthrixaceae bacterium]